MNTPLRHRRSFLVRVANDIYRNKHHYGNWQQRIFKHLYAYYNDSTTGLL